MSEDLSADDCQARIDQFVQITETDDAMAQFFLQDRNWDVESSVTAFFESNQTKSDERTMKRAESNQSTLDEQPRKKVKLDISESLKNFVEKQMNAIEHVLPEKLSLISWNIDGLDDRNRKERTNSVAKLISTRKVDIVLLQEIVSSTYDILKSKLSSDYIMTKKKEPPFGVTSDQFYFTIILLKRTTMKLHSVAVKPFDNSSMFRDLTLVKVKLQNEMKLVLITSHLESTKSFATPRMEQLKEAFEVMKEQHDKCTVIFAGDMNARDTEVAKVGIPDGIEDLWVKLGKRKECEYTWDTLRNQNVQMPGKFKPRCRFDRVYYKPSIPKEITPKHFGLCGIEKVQGMQCFPSDHWGLYCLFDIEKGYKQSGT